MEFPDDIACMFLAIKHAKDKRKMAELVEQLPHFRKLEEETYDTIWNYVGNQRMLELKKVWENEGGKINMRCAIDEIYEDGIAVGKEYGISSMLELLRELGYTEDNARFQLEMKFHLSQKEADGYVKKYWGVK